MEKIIRLTFLLAVFSILFISESIGQVELKGKIIDENEEPLVYAEVQLMTLDSISTEVYLTEEFGEFVFNVEKGEYILLVRQFGTILHTSNVSLNENKDLGVLNTDSSVALNEVTVVARKPTVIRKIDRLVFNIENTITSSQGTALDVLAVTPGLRVRNESISMAGKSEVAVMIDGKILQLSGEELSSFLLSIPSEDIKSVEVITTPPAKYDALGNGGIVNIQLKKARKDSWNAMVGGAYSQRSFASESVFGNINLSKSKFSMGASLNLFKGKRTISQDDYAYFNDGLWYTTAPYISDLNRLSGRFTVQYEVTPNWKIGSQYLVNLNDNSHEHGAYTPVRDYISNDITRYLDSDNTTETRPRFHSINLYNGFNLDTTGKRLTVDIDYFKYDNNDDKQYQGVSVIETPFVQQEFSGRNSNHQTIENWSGKFDFVFPLKWIELTTGGKISFSESNDDISFYNTGLVDELENEYQTEKNEFEYTENIQAVYISGNKAINEKLEVQLGLRLEAIQTESFQKTLDISTPNDYIKLFPTFYLGYAPNEDSYWSLSYNRRVNRPRFSLLNSNIEVINPFQSIRGNPFLQPSFIDLTELSYSYKSLTSGFYFSYEDSKFDQVSIPNSSTNFVTLTNENYVSVYKFGLTESYIFDKFIWWNSSNDLDLNYSISYLNLDSRERREAFSASISTYNTFTLNKKRTILLGLNYWYDFPSIAGIYKVSPIGSLSTSLQFLLLKKKLKITVKGNDLLRTEKEKLTSTVNGIYQEGEYYYDSQSFGLSLSYKFGNDKIRSNRRNTGNKEERRRTGN